MSEDSTGFLPPIVVTSVNRLHPGAKGVGTSGGIGGGGGGKGGGGGASFLESNASAPVAALLGKLSISDDSFDNGNVSRNSNVKTKTISNSVADNDDEDKIRAGVFVLDKTYDEDYGHSLGIDGVQSSGSSANSTPATSSQSRRSSGSAGAARKPRKPISMQRAKQWSPDVENAFRYQLAGFKDSEEYLTLPDNSQPEYWLPEGLIKCLRSKKTGYFMYFRRTRECEDKFLNRIILYQY